MTKTKYQSTAGYVGLGDMGGGIATHLAEVGVDLIVFDLNQAAIDQVVVAGARAAQSLQDLAAAADVIIVCVDPEPQVQKVIDALIPHLRHGQTVIIQSSALPTWLADVADEVSKVGAKLFDAPVSGTYEDRKNGTLSVLTGASAEAVGDVADLLESIGRPIYLNSLGGGEVAKLANNAIMMVTRLAVSEVMDYARAWGLSEDDLLKAVQVSSGSCFVTSNWEYFNQQLLNGNSQRGAVKQKLLILETAKTKNVRMHMLEAGRDFAPKIDEARYDLLTGGKAD